MYWQGLKILKYSRYCNIISVVMLMLCAYKYRLYPTKEQIEFFSKSFGCVRFIYNKMLGDRIEFYNEHKEKLNNAPAQYKDEFPWLKEVDSLALASAWSNLQAAYNKFFSEPNTGFPNFKAKYKSKASYTTHNQKGTVAVSERYIKLPKIGLVRIKKHREIEGLIKSATISMEPSGKYYVSILVEQNDFEKLILDGSTVGIDLGITDYAITSDGGKIENPRCLVKSEKRLKKLQRDLSRKKKKYKNRNKSRIKVARQHDKIKNQRKDFLHKESKRLIDENQVICLEDLNVKGLVKNHKLAKHISDVSWSKFKTYLEYKAKWYGSEIIYIDRFFPSSQICSCCGHRDGKKPLDIRQWKCPKCGIIHDRDINAAKNILAEGMKIRTAGIAGLACGVLPS